MHKVYLNVMLIVAVDGSAFETKILTLVLKI